MKTCLKNRFLPLNLIYWNFNYVIYYYCHHFLVEISINHRNEAIGNNEFLIEVSTFLSEPFSRRIDTNNILWPHTFTINQTIVNRLFLGDKVRLLFHMDVEEFDPGLNEKTTGTLLFDSIPSQNPLTMDVFRRVIDREQKLDVTFRFTISIQPLVNELPELIRMLMQLLEELLGEIEDNGEGILTKRQETGNHKIGSQSEKTYSGQNLK